MIKVPDFEALYRTDTDPWRVASSFYEQRKLDLVLAALSRPVYDRAWDPACGTGHLAARLSPRCGEVLATDLSKSSTEIASKTCAGLENVVVERREVPGHGAPAGGAFDLVVLSEFLYYLGVDNRTGVLDLLERVTAPRAEVLAVHWRHHPHDAWLSGAEVQAQLRDALLGRGWRDAVRLEDPDFALHTWRRVVEGD